MCQFDNELRVPHRTHSRQLSTVAELLQNERTVDVLDHSVALARGILEALAIEDLYTSASVRNQTSAFKHAGSNGYRRSSRPEHLRKKFMRNRQILGTDSVLAH